MIKSKVKRGTLAVILTAGALALGINVCNHGPKQEKLREETSIFSEIDQLVNFDYSNLRIEIVVPDKQEVQKVFENKEEKVVKKRVLKKHDMERLEEILNHDSIINDYKLFRALIDVESKNNFWIGSRGTGNGLAQITLYATAGAMGKMYSTVYPGFQEEYKQQITEKKKIINELTDNYFGELDILVREYISRERARIKEAIVVLKEEGKDSLVEERRIYDKKIRTLKVDKQRLGKLEMMINRGYIITDKGMMALHNRAFKKFSREKEFNDYMIRLTGKEKDWANYLGRQEEMVKTVHKLAVDKNNPEFHIKVVADTFLASLIYYNKDKKNPVYTALRKYNGNNPELYLKKVKASYNRIFNREMPNT